MKAPAIDGSDPRVIAQTARCVSSALALATRDRKDAALLAMVEKLSDRRSEILTANQEDLDDAAAAGFPVKLIQRLRFGEKKIIARQRSLQKIAELPDPVGEVVLSETRPIGLEVARVRVPLGVVLMVCEARPHVTVNAGAFCVKSGNAAILRGGSEAKRCNGLLGRLWQESLVEAGLPGDAIQVIAGSHEQVHKLLELDEYIDLVIPRGGKGLIKVMDSIYTHFVREFDRTIATRSSAERRIGAELKFPRFVCIAKRRSGSHMRGSKGRHRLRTSK